MRIAYKDSDTKDILHVSKEDMTVHAKGRHTRFKLDCPNLGELHSVIEDLDYVYTYARKVDDRWMTARGFIKY